MFALATAVVALSPPTPAQVGRRQVLLGGATAALLGRPALSVAAGSEVVAEKLRNLPAAKMAEIVTADLVERQFLATADFTREIYDEATLFTDEIDTYTLPKFIKGTSSLFVKEKSVVRLVGAVTVCAMHVPCPWMCRACGCAMRMPWMCHACAFAGGREAGGVPLRRGPLLQHPIQAGGERDWPLRSHTRPAERPHRAVP